MLRARVLDYLRAHHVMTLATHGAEGPWAAAVFYASDGCTLYWLSAPSSRHSVNLAQSPRVAATIQENEADWSRIKGVQLAGVACELSGDEAEQARAWYGEKFPVVGNLARAPAAIVAAMAKVHWYRLVPERLYMIDNSVGFGHREELIMASRTLES